MKRFFLINPAARRGRSWRRLVRLCASLRERLGAFDHAVTESGADAETRTRAALRRGADQIVVFGGDGTVNAAVNGFFEGDRAVRPEACLVVSRCGTGSDYYRSIAPGRDWTEQIERYTARAVDVGRIDFLDHGAHRYFINMASVGISALAVHGKLGPPVPAELSYLVPGIRALLTWRAPRVRVRSERLDKECELFNLFAAKGRYAGGGLRIGGGVALDDGRFDLTVVEKMGIIAAIPRVLRLLGAGLREDRYVHRHPTNWVEITSVAGRPLPMEADGEAMDSAAVRLRVLSSAVRLCFPV